MKPRILLINPWIHDFAAFNLWAKPLGLLKVAEYLSGFDVELLYIDCMDCCRSNPHTIGKYRNDIIEKPGILRAIPRYFKRYGISTEKFSSRIKSFMPFDVVLLTSIMAYWYPGVREAITLVRDRMKVPIVLGGIYPTLYPEHASRNSGAESIYAGPLQHRLNHVLEGLGIALRELRSRVPYYEMDLYPRLPFAPLLTSTGCPYHCSYCASRLLSSRYQRRPIDEVLKEISELSARGVRDFAFYDDALLFGAEDHLVILLKEVVRKRLTVRFHAPNGLHARFINDDLAQLMKAAGFRTVRLSLETLDPVLQMQTGGKVSTRDFENSVKILRKNGFTKQHLGAYLMYGLPGQGLKEVEEGIEFLKGMGIRIHLAEFSPIRGTPCWDDLVKRRVIPDDLDPLLTNNTVFSFLYCGYEEAAVEKMKIQVKNYNQMPDPDPRNWDQT